MDVTTIIIWAYIVIGVLAAGAVWRASAGTWDPSDRTLWHHVSQVIIVMVLCGLLWPGAALLAAMWKTERGRRWIIRWLQEPD